MCETGSIGVCLNVKNWEERTVGYKKWRPIDSNVMNAGKCLEINQNESSYEERSDYR